MGRVGRSGGRGHDGYSLKIHIVGWEKPALSKCLSGWLWVHLDRMVFQPRIAIAVLGFTYSIYQLRQWIWYGSKKFVRALGNTFYTAFLS